MKNTVLAGLPIDEHTGMVCAINQFFNNITISLGGYYPELAVTRLIVYIQPIFL